MRCQSERHVDEMADVNTVVHVLLARYRFVFIVLELLPSTFTPYTAHGTL